MPNRPLVSRLTALYKKLSTLSTTLSPACLWKPLWIKWITRRERRPSPLFFRAGRLFPKHHLPYIGKFATILIQNATTRKIFMELINNEQSYRYHRNGKRRHHPRRAVPRGCAEHRPQLCLPSGQAARATRSAASSPTTASRTTCCTPAACCPWLAPQTRTPQAASSSS